MTTQSGMEDRWSGVRSWAPPPELSGSGPRQVQLKAGGKAMVFMAVVVVAGAVALYVFLSRQAAKQAAARAALAASGIQAEGTVTRRWNSGDKSHTPMLDYEFEYQGRAYRGSSSAPRRQWDVLPVGSPITIRFLPDRPSHNHPGDWKMDVLAVWTAPATSLVLGMSSLFLFFAIRKQIALLRDGAPAAALITAHRRVKGGTTLVYEFRLPDNSLVKGRGGQMRNPPQIGSVITVLYDPEKPGRNAPYPLDAVRIAS
jgi:hypothetical protein